MFIYIVRIQFINLSSILFHTTCFLFFQNCLKTLFTLQSLEQQWLDNLWKIILFIYFCLTSAHDSFLLLHSFVYSSISHRSTYAGTPPPPTPHTHHTHHIHTHTPHTPHTHTHHTHTHTTPHTTHTHHTHTTHTPHTHTHMRQHIHICATTSIYLSIYLCVVKQQSFI